MKVTETDNMQAARRGSARTIGATSRLVVARAGVSLRAPPRRPDRRRAGAEVLATATWARPFSPAQGKGSDDRMQSFKSSNSSSNNDNDSDSARYRRLLRLAEASTFSDSPDDGEAAARSAALQEGERALLKAIEMRPAEMAPRVALARNLMLQGGGREDGVPPLALQALQRLAGRSGGGSSTSGSSTSDDGSGDNENDGGAVLLPTSLHACQLVLLGVKALWSRDRAAAVPDLVARASAAVPSLAGDFERLAARVEEQVAACGGSGGRSALLESPRFLSCVDLAAVDGRHHAAAAALGRDDPVADEGTCSVSALLL